MKPNWDDARRCLQLQRMAGWLLCCLLAVGCQREGSILWVHKLPGGSVSTPLVAPSFIAVGSEAGLSVLTRAGQLKCHFDAHGEVIGAPKSDGHTIYFASTNYIAYAITTDCKLQWKYLTQDRIKSDPLLDNGRVYITSYDGHIYALDAGEGTLVWTYPHDNALQVGGFSYSSPTIVDGILYVGNLDGYLYAVNASDGSLVWRFKTLGTVTSSPYIKEGVVYFGSNDGSVYAVIAQSGLQMWKTGTRDWVNSSPRIYDGVLYIGGNDHNIYAMSPSDGHVMWKFELQGPAVAIPNFYKNLVIAAGGSGDGKVYAIDRETQLLSWSRTTGGKIDSDPVIVENVLYVSSMDGFLYAINLQAQ